ncbi:MAG: hypothetical protein Q8Q54_08965 [Methylococcales bacterium]|nr:hypothetical protein [Methylococcales bacterium]
MMIRTGSHVSQVGWARVFLLAHRLCQFSSMHTIEPFAHPTRLAECGAFRDNATIFGCSDTLHTGYETQLSR